jgi:hypothetical protein
MRSSPEPAAAARPRAGVLSSLIEGWRRALRAPALALGLLAVTFAMALPMALVLQGSIERHLGASLDAENASAGWHAGWAAEFGAQAKGFERTLTHEILGFGATLGLISDAVDREALDPGLAAAAAAYVALWVCLSGGILDRLARGRPVRTAAFFAACGTFAVRFVRLALVVGAVYWAIVRWLHPYLFSTLYGRLTRDLTSETDAMWIRAGGYAVFLGALALVSVVADFAKIRAVVEDRRSMLGALGASVRFIRRRPMRVASLYVLNVAVFGSVLALWMAAAPGAAVAPWQAFLLAELYLLARIWAKLAFLASEVAFFQGELAHAHYAAAPELTWPDSPAAEAIENLSRRIY